MSRTIRDERQDDMFALFAAPPPAPRLPTAAELEATHSPAFFGCFDTEVAALADAATFRTKDDSPYTVQQVADQWNVYRWHAKPKPEGEQEETPPPDDHPLPTTGDQLIAQAIACCGNCEATSPASGDGCRTIWTTRWEERGELLCFDCIGDRNHNCQDCGVHFAHGRSGRNRGADRQWITTEAGAICWRCKDWRDMNKPQPELTSAEAHDEARARMATLQWSDDAHRNRATHRLRDGFERAARHHDQSAAASAKAKRRREAMIDAPRVERMWRITRHRPVAVLAEELWPLIDAHDRALRAGEGHDPDRWRQVDELLSEANGGTSCGIMGGRIEFPGAPRLWTLIRWRARREGRVPMWGVPGKFRIQCRGMHIVVSHHDHYRATTYGSEGFHLDRDKHKPGDKSFSSTGYRSMGYAPSDDGCSPQEAAIRSLESYIDAPAKNGNGMGGKLERWRPFRIEEALKRRNGDKSFLPTDDAEDTRHAHWNSLADEGERWIEEGGFDPYVAFPELASPRQKGLL